MLLAIDVGNTNTVFAVFKNNELLGQWRAATDPLKTADEYVVWLNQLFKNSQLTLDDIKSSILSTVVPQCQFAVVDMCERYCGCTPINVGVEGIELGIEINVESPREVGADRLANAVGAHSTYKTALTIIDFGTATTFDVIAKDGSYEGGVIAPGVNLSLEALHQAAAQLPRVAIRKPEKVIAQETVSAMEAGVYWGYLGLIEGIVKRMQKEYHIPMNVIATGGLAPLFANGTKSINVVDLDLTIKGLLEIYKLNTQQSI
ncbi:MAG: pantothenate kinase [Gammaproteobacteria bacterium]|jgi:type III pantothenate kinase|nr:pantothenate kinase [Gammaproteobacteria bacterium]